MNTRYYSHEDIKEKFVAVRQRAIAIYNQLTDNCFKYEFDSEKWNICQHFDHLLKFGEYHIPFIDRALIQIIENRDFSNEDFLLSRDESALISRLEDSDEELFSPSYLFTPENNLSRGTVFIKFVSMQDLFISQINLVDGYTLGKYEVEVTIDRGYTLGTGAAFLMIAAYEQRHLAFAESLRSEIPSEQFDFV